MNDLAKELENAIDFEDSVSKPWAQVFLKSGQVMWVPGVSYFEVRQITAQEASTEGEVILTLVEGNEVCFYDSDNEFIDDIYLPFENVAAIRVISPLSLLDDETIEEG